MTKVVAEVAEVGDGGVEEKAVEEDEGVEEDEAEELVVEGEEVS
jgi:hypothetical protein